MTPPARRRRFRAFLILSAVFAAGNASMAAQTPGTAAEIAVVGVTVIPMDRERTLPDHTVLIRDGRIAAVTPAAEAELDEGVERIPGAGRFLIPGLAEWHGHLPGAGASPQRVEEVLMLYAANGVTVVRGMQGHPSQLELRERIAAGEIVGPRLLVGSPALSGRVESPGEAERLVSEYAEAGFDLLKVHEGFAPEVYRAVAAAARERGLPFAGHVADRVGLFDSLAAGQDTVDHLDNFVEALIPENERAGMEALRGIAAFADRVDAARLDAAITALLDSGAAVVPTMVLWESGILPTRPASALLAERDEVKFMPPETVERWTAAVQQGLARPGAENHARIAALRREILAALHAAGAPILFGTDSPQIFSVPGFSVRRELALQVEVGMTPWEALATATRAVADHSSRNGWIPGDFGVVAPGNRADLVLLEANPLEDLAAVGRIAGVFLAGRFLDAAEIATALDAIAARHAAERPAGSPAAGLRPNFVPVESAPAESAPVESTAVESPAAEPVAAFAPEIRRDAAPQRAEPPPTGGDPAGRRPGAA